MSEIERDRELDAAWRRASREEPPAELDATIRAAARREVRAGPGRARATRWWPLAAVAAIAAIAVGIVQLTPPEQVTPTVATDTPGVKQNERPPAVEAQAQGPLPAAPAHSAARPAGSAMMQERAPADAPKKSAGERTPERGTEPAPARGRTPSAETEVAAAPGTAPTPATGAATRSESFVPTPPAAPSDATVPAAPPSAPGAEENRRRGAALASRSAPSEAAREQTGSLAAGAVVAPDAGGTGAEAAQRRALARAGPAEEAKRKDAQRPPAEWIALIRRLKAEGNADQAAKELAAFRAAYKERADALLPADLREPKP